MYNRRNIFCQSTNKLGMKVSLTTALEPLPPNMVTEMGHSHVPTGAQSRGHAGLVGFTMAATPQ